MIPMIEGHCFPTIPNMAITNNNSQHALLFPHTVEDSSGDLTEDLPAVRPPC